MNFSLFHAKLLREYEVTYNQPDSYSEASENVF